MQRSGQRAQTRITLLCALGILCALWPTQGFAILPHRANREVHKQIEDLELQWRDALLKADTSTSERLLDDDYIGISANGTIQTKTQTIAAWKANAIHYDRLDLNDIHVRVYGDTAVVTSKADVVGRNGDVDVSGRYRYTRVYHHKLGSWKIVSFEASKIDDSRNHN